METGPHGMGTARAVVHAMEDCNTEPGLAQTQHLPMEESLATERQLMPRFHATYSHVPYVKYILGLGSRTQTQD